MYVGDKIMKHQESKTQKCTVHIVGDKAMINNILKDIKARGLIKSFEIKSVIS